MHKLRSWQTYKFKIWLKEKSKIELSLLEIMIGHLVDLATMSLMVDSDRQIDERGG